MEADAVLYLNNLKACWDQLCFAVPRLVVRLRKLGSAGLLTVWAHKIFSPVLTHRRNMRPESGIFQPGRWPSALCDPRMTRRRQKDGPPGVEARRPCTTDGVIRFQHRRKINCGSYSNTCALSRPHDPRKLLVTEGLELLKTRSCYEYHPPGLSKKVRTAMGRQIFTADADHASTSV